jgi:signal transduction histidine kinase
VTDRIADSDQPLGLVIDVIDRGCGIEPGLREHLFERGARGRQTPGAEHGLGLYIVRRVMELHGGAGAPAAHRRRRHDDAAAGGRRADD